MLRYQTTTPAAGFGGPQIAADMKRRVAPFSTQSANDVYDGMAQARAVDLERYAQKAAGDYEAARQQQEMQSVLAGLNQLAQAQQGERSLADSRASMLTGFAGNLLGGLLR